MRYIRQCSSNESGNYWAAMITTFTELRHSGIHTLYRAAVLAFSLATILMLAAPAIAQPQLTPAQVQQLQSLSEQERSALEQQLGGTVGERQTQIPEAVSITPVAAVAATQAEAAIEQDAQQRQQTDDITTDQVAQTTTRTPLTQFGYELFAGSPSTFAPTTNIPVPSSYVMGPSDTVIIQLYGQRNLTHELVITREGMLMFPEIGPVSVAGLTFQEMRDQILNIVANQLIGQNATITLGALRSINVFVLGEAARPGSYTVSSLSTMTNALFASGGVTRIGSLRSIRLMRNGVQVTELDLYDLLLRGDTSGDSRLLPGDVIFIPPVGKTVGIAGEVRRPAIYELKNESSPADILSLSGGLNPTAFPRTSRIERINANGERIIVNVDLSPGGAPDPVLNDGDVIQVYSVLDQLENVVMLEGHVHRPGSFQWRQDLRISDVLSSVEEMLPNPDLEYALIARETRPARRIELVYVNLGAAIGNPGGAQDLTMEPRDQLLTFGVSQSRQAQVAGLLSRLRSQASFENPPLIVNVRGNVRFAGAYPLVRNMSLSDAIRFAGGLQAGAQADHVMLERKINQSGMIEVLSTAIDAPSASTPILLQEEDEILVFNVNEPREELLSSTLAKLRAQADAGSPTQIVSAGGQVRFPGEYPLERNMSVADLISFAGGLTESAETSSAEIARYDADPDIGRVIGIVNIDLRSSSSEGVARPLAPFDQLVVRQMPNWTDYESVSIGGEVNSPGTYAISKDETLGSLIARAGGLTAYAEPRAAIFLREELRVNEQRMLDEFRQQLERDIVTESLLEDNAQATDPTQLLTLVTGVEATGRLVIDLPALLQSQPGRGQTEVFLRAGDRLLIPRTQQEVSVIGEVNRPTSHLYARSGSVADYIKSSGGFTRNADKKGIFIIRASGEVVTYGDSRWFFQQRERLEAGDSIIVPFDTYKPSYLAVWRDVSQILFNISTTLLAIERVGN